MFRLDARKTVLALSLFAAVGAMLPGSHAASAAPIPATESAADLHLTYEQAPPKPTLNAKKLTWEVLAPNKQANGITYYHFRLDAHGGPHGNVQVQKEYYINNYVNPQGPFSDPETLGTMFDGEVKDVYITCKPILNYYCNQGMVHAVSLEGLTADASDPTNGETRHTNYGY